MTAAYLGVGAAAFYYLIACYPYWHGLSSFGNRFFISLTTIFIFGLALLFERAALCSATMGGRLFRRRTGGGTGFVEPGTDVPVGRAPYPGSWGNFFWTNDSQSIVCGTQGVVGAFAIVFVSRKSEMHKIEQQDIQQQEMQHRSRDGLAKVR